MHSGSIRSTQPRLDGSNLPRNNGGKIYHRLVRRLDAAKSAPNTGQKRLASTTHPAIKTRVTGEICIHNPFITMSLTRHTLREVPVVSRISPLK